MTVNAGGGAFDGNGAAALLVEVHGAGAADDAVTVAVILHAVKCSQQQRNANALTARCLRHAGGAEESFDRGVIAGKTEDLHFLLRLLADGDKDALGGEEEGVFRFTSPVWAEILVDPLDHRIVFRANGASDLNVQRFQLWPQY